MIPPGFLSQVKGMQVAGSRKREQGVASHKSHLCGGGGGCGGGCQRGGLSWKKKRESSIFCKNMSKQTGVAADSGGSWEMQDVNSSQAKFGASQGDIFQRGDMERVLKKRGGKKRGLVRMVTGGKLKELEPG